MKSIFEIVFILKSLKSNRNYVVISRFVVLNTLTTYTLNVYDYSLCPTM